MVKELLNRWPGCRIVHGRPRHSQSQGSVERANQDVEKILCTQLREEKSTKWARILPIVQSMKNRRFHRGIGRSPFEAMFGRKMVLANENGKIPTNEERNVTDIDNEVFEGEKFDDWSEAILATSTENPSYFPESDEELDSDRESVLTQRDAEIEQHRKGAVESQQKQADKMLEKSKNRFGPVGVGMTVRLPIDVVDRPKIGHSSLFGVVLSLEEGLYQIGTKNGVLQQKLTRNQFEPANNNFLSADDVPSQNTTFRAAIGAESLSGTQGHKHCNCTNGCTNGRYSARIPSNLYKMSDVTTSGWMNVDEKSKMLAASLQCHPGDPLEITTGKDVWYNVEGRQQG
ncbi:unnamed protein product, partial [Mesorhabditis belari]|uniref:Integrase catalytic domain-containing protein n=1 Tax=Mesorhabditis belari TaxID=2138241 RepID=A0AAF3EL80_9BILA